MKAGNGDKVYLSVEEAIGYLPENDQVHTFLQGRTGVMIGADWGRDQVIEALREAPDIEVTGPTAQAMDHGLAISRGVLSILFIETVRRTDEEAEP